MARKNLKAGFVRTAILASLAALTLAGATGCASTGVTSISTRASRFGAYPIDDELVQQDGRAPSRSVQHVARGYGYIGG